jgi:hypothetical protein
MFASEVLKHAMKTIAFFAFVLFAGTTPAIGQTAIPQTIQTLPRKLSKL